MRELAREAVQEILEAEMTETLGTDKHERTADRRGQRARYYGRSLTTRVGKIELRVPQDPRDASAPRCSRATSGPKRRSFVR